MRLDRYLVENFNIDSRNKSQELIESGFIFVNDLVVFKNNYDVKINDIVTIKNYDTYVSRAALKLKHAMDIFKIDLENKNVIDIGSSTGGFVQVISEGKANTIYAIDVGTNQLHYSLRELKNIIIMENTNFKNISINDIKHKIDYITCDVSFISSKQILKKIKDLFNYNIKLIFLLKPQFEAGINIIRKHKGYVPIKYHKEIIDKYYSFCNENNIKILNIEKSPITGAKSNNIEYLLYMELKYE